MGQDKEQEQAREKEDRLTECKKFIKAVEEFGKVIDPIVIEQEFEGVKMEAIAKDFFKKHQAFIESFPFKYSHFRFPNCSQTDIIEEDLQILLNVEREEELEQERKNNKMMKQQSDTNNDNDEEEEEEEEILEAARKSMAFFYIRACAACYLRLTLYKSRYNKEQDRREPLDLARYAIRYDSTDFYAIYWFAIAQGWYCDNITKPKERILLGRCFHQAALNCIRMNPDEYLGHNLLGRFYFNVASLSWLERTISNKLFGGNIEGSYQDAEREFLRSHELKQWLPTGLWMARTLLAQQRPMDEVKKWIDFGLSVEVREPTSEIERGELLELRSKLKLCPEQS